MVSFLPAKISRVNHAMRGIMQILIFCLLIDLPLGHATGFDTSTPSTSALGNSLAGMATGSHDISDMFANPAVLTQFSGRQFITSANYIDVGVPVDNGATAFAFDAENIDITADASKGEEGGINAWVPMLYFLLPLNDDLKWGLSVNAPFGLATKYGEQWIGRYHAIESEVRSLNISNVLAYQINEDWSVAGGIQIQYFDALLSTAIDFGTLAGFSPSGTADGFGEATADDWGAGFRLGALYHPNEQWRVGLGYRSKISHTLHGETKFEVTSLEGMGVATATGGFVDTNNEVRVTTPEVATFGVLYNVTPLTQVVFDIIWTRWSRIEEVRIQHSNPFQSDDVTTLNWENSRLVALGVSHRYSPHWVLRTGIAHENTALDKDYMVPRVPVDDKWLISFGTTYRLSDNLDIDVSYSYQYFNEGDTELSLADANNLFRGSLSAQYDTYSQVLSAGLRYSF